MNTSEIIDSILAKKKTINTIYFVACGGSLVDLYSGHYFIQSESESIHSTWITSKELILQDPKKMNKHSLLIVCSHGGNTKESVEAAKYGVKRGASVITLTHTLGSACDDSSMIPIIYSWKDSTNEKEKPQGIVLSLLNELLKKQESNYSLYDAINQGLQQIDKIVRKAKNRVKNDSWLFAQKYHTEPFLYILASGASFSQAYGFAICSLQEMQWIDCGYIHSGEYFHGPFEVTDEDHLYVLLMSRGRGREMDQRALNFLEKHGKKYEVIDANYLGMDQIDDTCVEYFNPILFYAMSVVYRTALQDIRNHPLDMRRYMGLIEY